MEQRYLGPVDPGMDVCDIHGSKVGTIAQVYAPRENGAAGGEDVIEVKTGPLGLGKRLYVPRGGVREGIKGCLFLAVSRDDFEQLGWHSKPQGLQTAR
jgi:hypothetical protein